MPTTVTQTKIELRVPNWIDDIAPAQKSFFDFLLSYAFSKTQDYKVRSDVYTRKYRVEFPEFERSINSSTSENMQKWDDFIVWKALYDSYKKWERRYHELAGK